MRPPGGSLRLWRASRQQLRRHNAWLRYRSATQCAGGSLMRQTCRSSGCSKLAACSTTRRPGMPHTGRLQSCVRRRARAPLLLMQAQAQAPGRRWAGRW